MSHCFAWMIGFFLLMSACARAPIQSPDQALVPTIAPTLAAPQEDLPYVSWVSGLTEHLRAVRAKENVSPLLAQSLARLLELTQSSQSFAELWPKITAEFDFFDVYGDPSVGDVFITGYYDLDVKGARHKHAPYTQPVYAAPKDMLALDLTEFDPKFQAERKYRARLNEGKLLPYYARAEIDGGGEPLKKQAEILCYMDPIDAFMMQVQGSGQVTLVDAPLQDSKLILNYADKNGQSYLSIGKFLKQKRPELDVNLHVLETYLRGLSASELQAFLNQNPSYVFFKRGKNPAITTLGTTAVDGRTIATDARYFPKGGVGLLISEKAVYDDPNAELPARWEPFTRLVLDQDTGGAITGPGRVDLFFGKDAEAKRVAGAMKRRGKLRYFLLKSAK